MARNIAVFGLYPSRESAEQGVSELRAAGFRSTDVSVLFPENIGSKDLALNKSTKAPEAAVAGAGSGAVIGGTLGWLAGIGSLAIPGLGPFIAAGPIMGLLAGLGAGGAVGGVVGGLVGMGIPEYEAKRYEGRIRKGGILLSAHCDNSEWAARAKKVLERTGAEDISSASEEKADFAVSSRPTVRSAAGVSDARPAPPARDLRSSPPTGDPPRLADTRSEVTRVRTRPLQINEVMTTPVETVDIEATLSEAASRMRRLNTCLLPVQSGTEVVGVISDRDISSRLAPEGHPSSRTTVRSAMITDFAYCFAHQDTTEAARIMEDRRIRDLLVLDDDKRVVGVISADAIAARTGSERLTARV